MRKLILPSILIISISLISNAESMRKLIISIDNQVIEFSSPPILKDKQWLVPLNPICQKLGLTVKSEEEQNMLVICGTGDSELCVPLQLNTDVFHVDGENYTKLEQITKPFGYGIYRYSKDKIEIIQPRQLATSFTLPNLNDIPVRLQDFRGKKTLLYIWGSW
ncbi:hypothetical protein JT359_05190 [Candidatus Poribacteria bacterium]|nr:hypothetical protein [Candidatus Poribacteria bacterium]